MRLMAFILSGVCLGSVGLALEKSIEEKAMESKGVAVVCASETTSDLEDAAMRINKKLMSFPGRFDVSLPTISSSNGRNNVCVTVAYQK